MKNFILASKPNFNNAIVKYGTLLLSSILLWFSMPYIFSGDNTMFAWVDPAVWQLIVLSVIAWLLLLLTSFHLFKWVLKQSGLPNTINLIFNFKTLSTWHQFVFYWASFALLFLGALLSLIAVL